LSVCQLKLVADKKLLRGLGGSELVCPFVGTPAWGGFGLLLASLANGCLHRLQHWLPQVLNELSPRFIQPAKNKLPPVTILASQLAGLVMARSAQCCRSSASHRSRLFGNGVYDLSILPWLFEEENRGKLKQF
jgi:hypothetical protein